jgi:hypothetical protein
MQRGKELLASWSISFRDISTASFGCMKHYSLRNVTSQSNSTGGNVVKYQEIKHNCKGETAYLRVIRSKIRIA